VKKDISKPLTKCRLFVKATWLPIKITLIVIFSCSILFQLIAFIASNNPIPWHERVTWSLFFTAVPTIFISAFVLIDPTRGIYRIVKQERALNFSFSAEMRKNNITELSYSDDLWFVNVIGLEIIVYRRDYIKEVISLARDKNVRRRAPPVLTAVRFDDKKIEISSSDDDCLKELEQWLLRE